MYKRKKDPAPKPEPRDRTLEEFEMHHDADGADAFEEEDDDDQPDENDLREQPSWEEHEETAEEAEERHKIHLQKKRNDKIFNNSYNTGDGPEYDHSGGDIRLSSMHPDSHLHDTERYRDHLDFQIIQQDIQAVVEVTPEILTILVSEPNKKKYTRIEINTIFGLLKQKLNRGDGKSYFVSPIQILEAVSNLTMLEYKKLFDTLEYEYKEDLIKELDKTHHILNPRSGQSKKLF